MAAGAYKGLTIRIGADTTKLSSALRGANSAIFKTQAELNKLSKAARIDPGNADVAGRQIGALAQQAVNASAKLETLNMGVKELGDVRLMSGEGTVRDYAEQLEAAGKSATLMAEETKRAYNDVDAELNKVYTDIKNATDGMVDIREVTNEGGFNQSYLDGLLDELQITQEQYDAIMKLKPAWTEARNAMEDAANVAQFDKLNNDIAATRANVNNTARELAKFDKFSSFAEMGKQLEPVNQRLVTISAASETARDRFSRLDKAAKLNPTSFDTAVQRSKALSEAIETTQQKATLLQQKIAAYEASGIDRIADSFESVDVEVADAEKAFNDAKRALDELVESGVDSGDEFERLGQEADAALKRMDTAHACQSYRNLKAEIAANSGEMKDLEDAASRSMGSVSTAAVNAAREVGNLMREAGQRVVQASDEIDSAYRDMRKTVEGTEAQYQALYDAAMKYSQTHVTSADTMLEMEALAGQVGISADALQNFSEVAANLDVATDISADEIALKMGQIVNVMSDLDEDNVRGFADALVDLGNHMPAQESAIMQIAQRLSSVGDVAGFSTPEILGWSAAIASTGQRSEAAATGISTTISTIQSAVSNGGDDLKAFADALGVPAEELAEKWRTDASGALRDFIGRIQELGPDAIKQLEDLGIEGVRQTQTILGLAKTVENVDKAMGISQGAWDGFIDGTSGVGAAAEEAERKAQGFSGSLAKMQNSAQVLAASLGPALVPYLDMAANAINNLTELIGSMGDDTKKKMVGVGGAFAVFATTQPIVKGLSDHFTDLAKTGIGNVVGALANVKKYADAGTTPLEVLDGKLGALKGGFGKVVGGVKTFGTTLIGLAESGTIAAGALGAVVAIFAGAMITDMIKAKQHADEMSGVLGGMKTNTENLGSALAIGARSLSDFGGSAGDAKTSLKDLIDSVNEHNSTNAATRQSAEESIFMLGQYKTIIDECAGAGEVSAEKQAMLEWALKGLADQTGETWSVEEVLTGKFKDQEGQVLNTKDAIDKLIESRQQEARTNAIMDMYTDALKEQEKAQKAVSDAEDEYNKQHEQFMKANEDSINSLTGVKYTQEELEKSFANSELGKNVSQNLHDAQRIYQGLGDEVSYYEDKLHASVEAEGDLYGEREGVMETWAGNVGDAMRNMGYVVADVAKGLEDAGVSSAQLAEMGSTAFMVFAEQAGGDMEKLIGLIQEYDGTQFQDKYGEIHVEDGELVNANGWIIQWNDEAHQLEYAETGAKVDITEVQPAVDEATAEIESIPEEHETEVTVDQETEVNVTADTSDVEEKAAETKESIESTPIEQTVTTKQEGDPSTATSAVQSESEVKVTVATDTTALDELNSALEQVQQDYPVNVTVTADTSAAGGVVEALATIPESIPVKITAKQSGVASAAKNVKTLAENASKMSDTRASYTASGNAATSRSVASNIAAINSAAKNMSGRTQYYNAYGNAATSDAPANRIWNLVNALRNLPTSKNVTVNYNLKKNGSAPAGAANSATGTYIPYNKMPKHAAGIFTQPTLTNIGWVGEDGAELYSGNSLVPLTNRKYSMPYINDISDAVARKLGDQQQGPSISITVNGVAGPDETADAIERKLRLLGF